MSKANAKNDIVRLDLSEISLLLVDDNQNMRHIVRAMLNAYGIRRIGEAEDGVAAVEQIHRVLPDIIITDWMMPIMDGLELTRFLRSPDSPDRMLPIIMMTSHSEKHRVLQARDCGITEFLCKPVSAKSMYLRISNIILNKRPFVQARTFFGPDRRRFHNPLFNGNEKRIAQQDPIVPTYGNKLTAAL